MRLAATASPDAAAYFRLLQSEPAEIGRLLDALVMAEGLPQLEAAGLGVPVLLGGAALTPKFVAESCVPGYSARTARPTMSA